MMQAKAGCPSIDKPWLKYYDESVCSAQIPEGSIWGTIYKNNKTCPDEVALLYFGREITYKKLRSCVDGAACAFAALGVRAGDNVALCMPAMPEAIYSILALNVLGTNAVLLNPTFDSRQMHETILKADARLLVVASEVFESVRTALEDASVSTVVECSAMNSLGILERAAKGKRKHPESISWNAFMKRGKRSRRFSPSKLSDACEALRYHRVLLRNDRRIEGYRAFQQKRECHDSPVQDSWL